jgi:molybdate transport system regulatory protein
MSYNKAYTLIRTIEGKLGCKLLTSKSGGEKGGGSELTEEAEKLISAYINFYTECELNLKQIFEKHFGEFRL